MRSARILQVPLRTNILCKMPLKHSSVLALLHHQICSVRPQGRLFATMSFVEEKDKYLSLPIDDKRKSYKCCDDYKTLGDVQTWADYFQIDQSRLAEQLLSSREKAGVEKREVRPDLSKKVSLWKGDITTLEIDAIVNAANKSLLGGGGVDGAIHRAAGLSLKQECRMLNGCSVGEAKITGGYMLPAKYVIHTVGPQGEIPQALQNCYESCLTLMKENNLKSIAFPCISTGIYGYPQEAAAKVALKTIRSFMEQNCDEIDRVILCLFLPTDVTIYENLLQLFFPVL